MTVPVSRLAVLTHAILLGLGLCLLPTPALGTDLFDWELHRELTAIEVTISQPRLLVGERAQLTVVAVYVDGFRNEITADPFTRYEDVGSARVSIDEVLELGFFPSYPTSRTSATGEVEALRVGRGSVRVCSTELFPCGKVEFVVRVPGDRDGDGLPDDYEIVHGLNPDLAGEDFADDDGDELNGLEELAAGTDPRNADTDGDGMEDGPELAAGRDPLTPDPPEPAPARPPRLPDESCTVSILNRTTRVSERGWVIPNLPGNRGPVRGWVYCLGTDGSVLSGHSGFFQVPAGGSVRVSEWSFESLQPAPERVLVTALSSELAVGEEVPLRVTAVYPGGSTAEVTAGSLTSYTTSNARIVAVDGEGRLTARGGGRAVISALHDGVLALLVVTVSGSGDSDGDGLPDDFELANGLDPADPADALEDPDGDGLTTLAEYEAGLDAFRPDTDGDGFRDGLEVATGSDPLDPGSFDLAATLAGLRLAPAFSRLVVNEAFSGIGGETGRDLRALGTLIDGSELDLTAPRYGTVLRSSDPTVALLTGEPGRLLAGSPGLATVTAEAGGRLAEAEVLVERFSPVPLAWLPLPGYANAVALRGSHAWVATGATGLYGVDVSEPTAPFVASAVDTPGNGNGLALWQSPDGRAWAYVADGLAGVTVVDISEPTLPRRGLSRPAIGDATAARVVGDLLYVAARPGEEGVGGLRIYELADPALPRLLGRADVPGEARDVVVAGELAYLAGEDDGLYTLAVADPTRPRLLGLTATRREPGRSHAAGLALSPGGGLLVADGARGALGGLRLLDLREPAAPVLAESTSDRFGLHAVAADGALILGADYFFRNGVPIFARTPGGLIPVALLDFFPLDPHERNGNDLALSGGLVFVAVSSETLARDNGVASDGGLLIGRYRIPEDEEGVAPTVALTRPEPGTVLTERHWAELAADARDDVRVEAVEFHLDGQLAARVLSPPWTARVEVPPAIAGSADLAITAVATDAGGRQTTSGPTLFPVEADAAPVAEILAPASGQQLVAGTALEVAVRATDDRAVSRVELFVNGELFAARAVPPYRFRLPLVTPGTLSLSALAHDEAGPSDPAAAELVVLPDAPPEVELLRPRDGDEVVAGGPLTLLAGATDDVAVAGVDFYVASPPLEPSWVGADSFPPYELTLSAAAPTAGSTVVLTAVAFDRQGQTATSTPVTVVGAPDPGTAVTGRAVDRFGSPVAGATVGVFTESSLLAGIAAAGGEFRLDGIPTVEGLLAVRLQAEGPAGLLRGEVPGLLEPVPGGELAVGEIVLLAQATGPGTRVVGQVVSTAGTPVGGARVTVHNGFEVRTGVTDPDGHFAVDGVPAEAGDPADAVPFYLFVHAESAGTPVRAWLAEPEAPWPGNTVDVGTLVAEPWDPDLRLETTAVGRVEDRARNPVPGATVRIWSGDALWETQSDADGRFEVPEVSADAGPLRASAALTTPDGEAITLTLFPTDPTPGGLTDLGPLGLPTGDAPRRGEPHG